MTRLLSAIAVLLLFSAASRATPEGLVEQLIRAAPGINPQVVTLAVNALNCATRTGGAEPARRLAVIDYSQPSALQRLWVFDLRTASLLYAERVAHGRGSGDNVSDHFSNLPGSHQSSLGLFRTRETYVGQNGYSLRLDGLEPGFNDLARERAIVMHGASYVSEETIRIRGGVGRSHGCPAVRKEIAQPLIDAIKDGQYLFAYYPDGRWLRGSSLLSCPAAAAAATSASPSS